MALAREALARGAIPLADPFAYVPTVEPFVHHEWASGFLLFALVSWLGGAGLLLLRTLLVAALAAACWSCARARGASFAVAACVAPIGILLVSRSLTTVRAQMLTLLFMALLLRWLEQDRAGSRRWIAPWLLVHTAWVNLHGGFVVGVGVFALHTLEQALRRRPVAHLALAGLLMLALLAATPYGWSHVSAVWQALFLDREHIGEWGPISGSSGIEIGVLAFSLLLLSYALRSAGLRGATGLVILLGSLMQALLHQRHLSLYAVACMCLVPAWLERTPLGAAAGRAWRGAPRRATAIGLLLGVAAAAFLVRAEPWRLRLPVNRAENRLIVYPAGAVEYLARTGFSGNVMTPFEVGAFVTWKLHPRVKVGLDGRYEAAYPAEHATEIARFYAAREGWRTTLARHPTDLVLARRDAPLVGEMRAAGGWPEVYVDDEFVLLARPGLALPVEDRRGTRLQASFP